MSSNTRSRRSKSSPIAAVRRIDGAGHMDPRHRNHLLELSREGRASEEVAFIAGPHCEDDDLAEGLGEEAIVAMTTGESHLPVVFDAEVEEDRGGPFVETSGNIEFAGGTDESNVADATREPFPTS